MSQLWSKDTAPENWVLRFTVGEDYVWDTLLLPYDVRGTAAHAWALMKIGVLTPGELAEIEASLERLVAKYDAGEVQVTPADEDCHTVIEHHLTAELAEVGKKIHAGRSRNDQVLVALRLYLKDALRRLQAQVRSLALGLVDLGEPLDDLVMPGYTHFQRAMPTTAGLWAFGFAELLAADLDALDAAHQQIDWSPWGSAAGYGVPELDLPRDAYAARLGFAGVQRHVPAVQLSRGKLELHVVHALVQVSATINRLAADLVLYSTSEYGFVELPDAFCTGSSIMPQKKNPDVLELARANHHRLLAEMNVLLTLPANLPSGYHRDLQLTKEAVMRAVLLSGDLLTAMNELVPGIQFNRERAMAALSPGLFATADALERVRAGQPFRDAYRETASRLDDLTVPPAGEALAAYRVPGYPGRGDAASLRRRLSGGVEE